MTGARVIIAAVCLGLCSASLSAQSGFDRALDSALPRVVKLYGLGGGMQAGYGSGIVVSEDGLVVTVYSLLIDARNIKAVASDGAAYGADVVYRDRIRQLALLQLKPGDGDSDSGSSNPINPIPYFDVNNGPALEPGDWVLAAGNAFKVAIGAEPASIAHGVFSARTRLDARRRLRDFPYRGDVLVIDAITSNPGAPGSAVVGLDGGFVGMVGRVVVSNLTHTHFNYAIPRDVLADFLHDAEAAELSPGGMSAIVSATVEPGVDPAKLGIRMSKVGYRTVLPFVDRVKLGSSAAKSGLRKDDLVLSVNGRSVADVAAFDAAMDRLLPDEAVDLVVRRRRKIMTLRIPHEGTQ